MNRTEIDNDTPATPKGPLARFFMSGWSNLVRMMGVNVLFIIFNIPALALCYYMAAVFIPMLAPVMKWDVFITVTETDGSEVISYQLLLLLVVFFVMALLSSLLICIGPFQAGFAQVYKGIRTNTSVSLFSDFKRGVKENWGKSLVAMLIGIVLTIVFMIAIVFYASLGSQSGIVVAMIFGILFFAFILIQNFVYNMMVATDLKLSKIYKNAILLVLLRFGPCLGLALLVIIFYFAVPFFLLMSASYLTLGIYLFLYSFVVISWMQYFMSYYTGKLIDKYVSTDD